MSPACKSLPKFTTTVELAYSFKLALARIKYLIYLFWFHIKKNITNA